MHNSLYDAFIPYVAMKFRLVFFVCSDRSGTIYQPGLASLEFIHSATMQILRKKLALIRHFDGHRPNELLYESCLKKFEIFRVYYRNI